MKDLFTYTEVKEAEDCPEYTEGTPITEAEFDNYQVF
jgi:hypothetical protein